MTAEEKLEKIKEEISKRGQFNSSKASIEKSYTYAGAAVEDDKILEFIDSLNGVQGQNTRTNKEVLELCVSWFEDIMERCDRLTSGNVSHGSRAIHGCAKNYAEFVKDYINNIKELKEN